MSPPETGRQSTSSNPPPAAMFWLIGVFCAMLLAGVVAFVAPPMIRFGVAVLTFLAGMAAALVAVETDGLKWG